MPELPEVETVCRQLQKIICGETITAVETFDDKLGGCERLKGKRVLNVQRRGKNIAIGLDDGSILLIHLRMTGRLLWQDISDLPRYARWKISFAGGNVFLVDPRRFATVKVLRNAENEAGREIFGEFDLKRFIDIYGGRKTKIKSLLMDQSVITGIGNIYACEILHRAGIHPERKAVTLAKADWKKIFRQAKAVLNKAIEKRGTSISDWRDLYGRKGKNQHELKVYGKTESACPVCGGTICRIKQSGRGTYFCPHCQK